MMLLPPGNAGKWAAVGIAFTAIVTAVNPERDSGAVKMAAQSAAPLRVNAASSSPALAKRRLPEAVHVELERLARPQAKPDAASGTGPEPAIGNAFSATSWYVPPPPPPPPAPVSVQPQLPAAPPMPFIYFGRYEDAPTLQVILLKGERMYVVAEGDVIEDTYRIERLAPGAVELTYIPLDIKQSLSTGEAL